MNDSIPSEMEQSETGESVGQREFMTPDPVEVPLHGPDGSESGTKTFSPGPVSNYPNYPLLKEAVRRQQGRLRRGTAFTKTRGEIRGSNRKPWRQKGTGRARAGSRKSPIWRGGGTTFGPRPRNYDYGLPKKQRRLATRHATLSKLLDGESRILEAIPSDRPATSAIRGLLSRIEIAGSCLIGLPSEMSVEERRTVALSCRNINGVEVLPVSDFNPLALLKHRHLLLTPEAFDELQEREASVAEGGAW
jgi:large subunit ribosomal protein L4